MPINIQVINEFVEFIESGGSLVDAVDTLTDADPQTTAVAGAVISLISQGISSDRLLASHYLGTAGILLSATSLGQSLSDGEFTMDDFVATSALIGSFLSRSPHPGAKAAGMYFNLLAMAPSFGSWLGGTAYDLTEDINDLWDQARNWMQRTYSDPLVLDLDGDGIETIAADGTVVFDDNGDGIKTGTGWVSADDALLVLDRNGNGSIDNGSELFGVDTIKADGTLATDGFDALSDLDSNNDGVFDAQDTEFANVRVWQDLDQDGVSDDGELQSLTEAGISSINLNATANNTDVGNDNVQTASSTFTNSDGTTGTVGNLDLVSNAFYREFTNAVSLTDEALALPNAKGSGMVRDLREAMSLSSGLTALVSSYADLGSYSDQRDQVDVFPQNKILSKAA